MTAPNQSARSGPARGAGRAYPLRWRLLDALERLAAAWPAQWSGAVKWALLAPALALVGLLLWGLGVMADASLREMDFRTYRLSGDWSLANYAKALGSGAFRATAQRSLLAAAVVTAVCLTLAFPYAYAMTRTRSARLRKLLLVGLFLPFFIGQVVRAYGWLIVLGQEGLANDALGALGLGPWRMLFQYPTVLFGLVQYMLPFAVLMLAPALAAIPEEVERAAESCGASWPRALLHVVIPMARPGLIAAALVVATLTLTDFATPAILGGGTNDFLANLVYDQFFRTSDAGLGSAITLILTLAGTTLAGVLLAAAGVAALGVRGAR
jgi:putative spermidine/putrescine transport system permease protein